MLSLRDRILSYDVQPDINENDIVNVWTENGSYTGKSLGLFQNIYGWWFDIDGKIVRARFVTLNKRAINE